MSTATSPLTVMNRNVSDGSAAALSGRFPDSQDAQSGGSPTNTPSAGQKVVGVFSDIVDSVNSSGPSPRSQRANELAVILERDAGRELLQDYKVPYWLKDVSFPFRYNKTFRGKYGIVNYDLSGRDADPLVVTLHGLNGTGATFADINEVLPRYGYRVLTFDFYGHGLSGCPMYHLGGYRYSLKFFVDQVVEVLEHLHLETERLNIIGFSMGCIVAAAVAARFRGQTDRLVLLSPAGLLESKPNRIRILKLFNCCIPVLPCFVCRCCFCFRQSAFRTKFFTKEDVESGLADSFWSRLMFQLFVRRGVIGALLGTVSRMPIWDAESLFRQVGDTHIPTLILWGRKDQVVPVALARKFVKCFRNSHLIVFRDASHLLLVDQPKPCIATILTYFEMPSYCDIKVWRYFLPFSPKGNYVPRNQRCPPKSTARDFQIKWRTVAPRRTYRMTASPTADTSGCCSDHSRNLASVSQWSDLKDPTATATSCQPDGQLDGQSTSDCA